MSIRIWSALSALATVLRLILARRASSVRVHRRSFGPQLHHGQRDAAAHVKRRRTDLRSHSVSVLPVRHGGILRGTALDVTKNGVESRERTLAAIRNSIRSE